jgi:hypothetical protein
MRRSEEYKIIRHGKETAYVLQNYGYSTSTYNSEIRTPPINIEETKERYRRNETS